MLRVPSLRPTHSLHKELICLGTILGGWAVVNLLTACHYPVAWTDEIMNVDPARNLVQLGKFQTMAWEHQDPHRFFTAYPPLYYVAIAGWGGLFGFDMLPIRSLNYFLVMVSILTGWHILYQTQLVKNPTNRLILLSTFILALGPSFSYRSGRIDWFMLFLSLLIVWGFIRPRSAKQPVFLFLMGFLVSWTGHQLVAYLGCSSILIWLFFPDYSLKHWQLFLALALGGLCGLAALGSLYHYHDTLDILLHQYVRVSGKGLLSGLQGKGFDHRNVIPKDTAIPLGILLVGILGAAGRRPPLPAGQKTILRWAIAMVIAIPLLMLLLGKFPTYYSWMILIPMAVAGFQLWESRHHTLSAGYRRGVRFMMGLIALSGLPLLLMLAYWDAPARNHRAVKEFVGTYLPDGQAHVVSSYETYYAVRPKVSKMVIAPGVLPHLPPHQRSSLSWAVLGQADTKAALHQLGGTWEPVAIWLPDRPPILKRLTIPGVNFAALSNEYRFGIYRRVSHQDQAP